MTEPILTGCSIALCGKFHEPHKKFEKLIRENGGKISKTITGATTHLVATQEDWDAASGKVGIYLETSKPSIFPVSIDWLMDSIQNGTRMTEAAYSMHRASSVSHSLPPVAPYLAAPQQAQSASFNTGAKDGDSVYPSAPVDTKSRKRALSSTPPTAAGLYASLNQKPVHKKQRDGQKAKSQHYRAPLDEEIQGNFRVHIGSDGLIYDASLNQTNAANNNNKFYRIQLVQSIIANSRTYSVFTRWGRVGERGQNKWLSAYDLQEAIRTFEAKFKEKSGLKWNDRLEPPKKGKYTFIERAYEESGDEGSAKDQQSETSRVTPGSILPVAVQDLMKLIFNEDLFETAMTAMSYDAKKLPLGKLSKRTLENGYTKLQELAELIADPNFAIVDYGVDFTEAIQDISNAYYSIIPHAFGRNRPTIISTEQLLKKEIELIESLSDMEIANDIMKDVKSGTSNEELVNALDRQFAALGLEHMTPLEKMSTEFTNLEAYLLSSRGQTHMLDFKVQEIFRVERKGEHDRFMTISDSDRRLLWHGSRTTNFAGILSQGLRIAPPEAPVSGYMFGKGVYLADISTKSANYCYAENSDDTGLLLLCEAELGKPMLELTNANYNAEEEAKKAGCMSTWGQGLTRPGAWKDACCVHDSLNGILMPDTSQPSAAFPSDGWGLQYNEYIVYDIAQIRIRYLLRVKIENDGW